MGKLKSKPYKEFRMDPLIGEIRVIGVQWFSYSSRAVHAR
jgi:hypothetical protein